MASFTTNTDFCEDDDSGAPSAGSRVYTVFELAHLIRDTLEGRFPCVQVEGEVSGYRGASQSGHHYFDLKDATGTLSVALFRGNARNIKAPFATGAQVRVTGRVSVFEKTGRMQLIATSVEPAGIGALLLQLEQLKEKLRAEGLFDESRKRPLPAMPRRIGVVTSPTGAVIKDIITTLRRRNPHFDLLLAPAPTQGATAAQEIVRALKRLDERDDIDVIIVARGGGSMEDLWCFNDEGLARAIAAARHPVITGVGHETDTTLVDYVSDRRAATPTAAAEIVLPACADVQNTLAAFSRRLRAPLADAAHALRRRFDRAAGSPMFRRPRTMVDDRRQTLDFLGRRLALAFTSRPTQLRGRFDAAAARLPVALKAALPMAAARCAAAGSRLLPAAKAALAAKRTRLDAAAASLRLLDPTAVLRRGYTLTRLADGTLLRSVADAPVGTVLATQAADGTLISIVTDPASPTPPGGTDHARQERTDLRGEPRRTGADRPGDGSRKPAARGASAKVRKGTGPDQGVLFPFE